MPFDVWLAQSCSTINNLTETSHLSKLNRASRTRRFWRGDVRVFGCSRTREREAQLGLFFLNWSTETRSVCECVCWRMCEREEEEEEEEDGLLQTLPSHISLAPSSVSSRRWYISRIRPHDLKLHENTCKCRISLQRVVFYFTIT